MEHIEYIECACRTELLQLTWDDDDRELLISYFSVRQRGNRHSIGQRLRHIWRIIKCGSPYNDFITVRNEDLEKLKLFINKI